MGGLIRPKVSNWSVPERKNPRPTDEGETGKFGRSNACAMSEEVKALEALLVVLKAEVERHQNMLVRKSDGSNRVAYLNDFVGNLEDRVKALEKKIEYIDSEVVRAHHRCDRIPPEDGVHDFNFPDIVNFVLIVILGLTILART